MRIRELITEAVETAKNADVALLVLGDNEQTCREGWSTNHLGDRDSLDLPSREEELLHAVSATGKPVILLLVNGRPGGINFAAEHVPAILEVLVSRPGRRDRRRRGTVRRCEPGRQIADHLPPLCWADPGLLLSQAIRVARLPVYQRRTAVPVRAWIELHQLCLQQPHLSKDKIAADETATLFRGCDQHRGTRRG